MIMEDTWERTPIEGKFTGVPGGTPLGETAAVLSSHAPSLLPALSSAGGWPQRTQGCSDGQKLRTGWELGRSRAPGCRDLLWEVSFGSLVAVFTQR